MEEEEEEKEKRTAKTTATRADRKVEEKLKEEDKDNGEEKEEIVASSIIETYREVCFCFPNWKGQHAIMRKVNENQKITF